MVFLEKRTLTTIYLFELRMLKQLYFLNSKLNIGYILPFNISRHQLLQKPSLTFVKINNIFFFEASVHSEQFLLSLCLLVVIFSFVILLRYLTERSSLADNSQTSLHYFWWIILVLRSLLKLRGEISWNAILSLELLLCGD